jgi:hypothetical protein
MVCTFLLVRHCDPLEPCVNNYHVVSYYIYQWARHGAYIFNVSTIYC